MATLTLRSHGFAPEPLAWERYADPALWSTWAPQIQRVDTDLSRLTPGMTGTVRAGLLSRPTLGIPFRVLAVDEAAREWSWEAHLGPLTLHLEHGVTAHPAGSATWLRIRGPWPVVIGYAPVARLALGRLVAA
ncbi:SRPBCC family protein [Marmoricola sp. URHB0036]|uniref:SRPBCC family protein n=1 Tax=Marmoricola sp. URHB0036 TaxID=1298863 RepID=UPI000400872C|nr:SRPBCC family protein [Marmoricola sp. URHB0036]